MALTFTDLSIPGTHGDAIIDPPKLESVRTHFAGLNGETEVLIGSSGRYIRYPIIVHHTSFTTTAKVVTFLQDMDKKIGTYGTLKETGNITRTFKNVTYEAFQTDHRILPDIARTLETTANTYFATGTVVFYQLSTADD